MYWETRGLTQSGQFDIRKKRESLSRLNEHFMISLKWFDAHIWFVYTTHIGSVFKSDYFVNVWWVMCVYMWLFCQGKNTFGAISSFSQLLLLLFAVYNLSVWAPH